MVSKIRLVTGMALFLYGPNMCNGIEKCRL